MIWVANNILYIIFEDKNFKYHQVWTQSNMFCNIMRNKICIHKNMSIVNVYGKTNESGMILIFITDNGYNLSPVFFNRIAIRIKIMSFGTIIVYNLRPFVNNWKKIINFQRKTDISEYFLVVSVFFCFYFLFIQNK